MRKLSIIFINGLRRSLLLIPLVLIMIALMCVCFLSGRTLTSQAEIKAVPIGIIDYDDSKLSNDMIQYLSERLNYKVISSDSYKELSQMLIDCDIAVILEVPEGFEDSLVNGSLKNLDVTILNDYENEAYTKTYINQYLERTILLQKQAGDDRELFYSFLKEAADEETKVVSVVGNLDSKKQDMDENGLSFMVGFFLLAGFGFSMYMGVLILEDKRNGTFQRIQISSIKPFCYISGMALGNAFITLLCIIGIGIMLKICSLQSNTPIMLVIAVLFLYICFCIGFNLVIALLCKATFLFVSVGIGFVSVTNIIGGAYFPIENSVFGKISILTPQYSIMNLFRGLARDPNYQYTTDLCVLLLMIVLIFLVAAVVYTRREK